MPKDIRQNTNPRKEHSDLLPPFTAVRMMWACTGKFTKEVPSQKLAEYTRESIKDIKELADAHSYLKEKRYISGAVPTMNSCLRSFDTIYKGRQLNFKEVDKIRDVYLENVKDNLEFGKRYPVEAGEDAEKIVRDLLAGVRPTFCTYIQKHMYKRIITPELWSLCETGDKGAVEQCPLWEG